MSPADGEKLGPYRLADRLASGGMATVYLAQRIGAAGFARTVALKVVHPHLADLTEFTEMFLDEARLSSRIDHPNVVRVDDFGNVDGRYFLAMEYIRGQPLAAVLTELGKHRRRMAPQLSVWIATQVAEGLHAAHEATDPQGEPLGLVHRDVSPQNVMVSYDGHVKVLDFGVAKAEGRLQLTREGSLKGKLAYMSPEQAWSRPVDRRADIFSLGVVLWELLVGRRLFRRNDDVETLLAVRETRVPAPRSAGAPTTDALDAVVLSALDRDPAARPPTASVLARRLLEACPEARTVRPADVAHVVRTLFADAIDRDVARERAAALDAPDAPRAKAADGERAWTQLTRSVPEGATPEAPTRILTQNVPASPPRRRGRRVAIGASLALVAVAAASAAAVLLAREEPRAEPAAASVPIEPASAVERAPAEPATDEPAIEEVPEIAEEPAATEVQALVAEEPARRPPRRSPRTAQARTGAITEGPPGRLTIATVPWATIAVDGRSYGQTPRTIELPPGRHQVVLRAEGSGPTRRLEVTVPPGGVVTRRVMFD